MIVVVSDLVYGVSHMYALRQTDGGIHVKLFRDMQEARRWLGLAANESRDHDSWTAPTRL